MNPRIYGNSSYRNKDFRMLFMIEKLTPEYWITTENLTLDIHTIGSACSINGCKWS